MVFLSVMSLTSTLQAASSFASPDASATCLLQASLKPSGLAKAKQFLKLESPENSLVHWGAAGAGCSCTTPSAHCGFTFQELANAAVNGATCPSGIIASSYGSLLYVPRSPLVLPK
ncbi:uncharacterized protein LOC124358999 [Homalodisca vitripennis]|uniref:uncharacterized protein LOC124358999 n=1 Tax=Homalodisca vitripennis TaxID=197043 RepID=UPI001EEA7C59|nr:uncharacterized protein LOC124358999 [Homalodisca vitripennis]